MKNIGYAGFTLISCWKKLFGSKNMFFFRLMSDCGNRLQILFFFLVLINPKKLLQSIFNNFSFSSIKLIYFVRIINNLDLDIIMV